MKDKVKFLIIAIAVMVVVIMAGTFAWLSYQSNKTAMVLTIGDISTVQVTLSPYQLDASIVPKTTFSDSSNKFINISVDNNSDFSRQVKLFFVINDIDESLISEDFRYTIMRKTTANGTYEPYEDGNFSGVDDAEYEILDETIPANSEYEYKVYVWLYGAENLNEAGVYFNGELRADISNKQYIRGGTFNVDYKAFNSNITRNQVEKIAFQIPKPTDITSENYPIDISRDFDNSVIAYFKDSNHNGKYEMYIAANGIMVAPSSMAYFFANYNNSVIDNIHYLDMSEVTDMTAMFAGSAIAALDLRSFNTSNVTTMDNLFAGCSYLASLNLGSFETFNVTSMNSMFSNCYSLTNLDISNFYTFNVTDFSYMFEGCYGLTSLDLSNFYTQKANNMIEMFSYCSNLSTIYVSDRWIINATSSQTQNMFGNCTSLPNYDSSVVNKTKAHYNTGGYLTYKPASY